MNTEYQEFLNKQESPPKKASEQILAQIHQDLHPSVWKTFSKLSLIHFAVALVTLSICPQFGIRLLGEGMGLMHVFMGLGDLGCPLACGFFFTGTTLLVASLVLRPEEIRALRRNRFTEALALTLLSLGFFVMIRAEIALGFALLWMLGSIIGSLLALELGWMARVKAYALP
ncbi:MAG: hypothetical protein ACJ763_09965 [Bdellovibrionia bacterium]